MLKIRLSRVGRKNRPLFRVVVSEKSKPVKSGYITSLGTWDPVKKKLEIDQKETTKWLEKGAKPSDTVNNLFVKNKIIKGKIVKTSKEKPVSDEDKKGNSKKKEETTETENKKEEPKEEKKKPSKKNQASKEGKSSKTEKEK